MSSTDSRWPHLADAADIIQWSSRVTSRTAFPGLVRRLILRNNDQVLRLQMRDAEGAGVPGFDGIVEAGRATYFVPEGRSVWELGVGADPQDKANSDYKKRKEVTPEAEAKEMTFVFVTSQRWPGKDAWAQRKSQEGYWRAVLAFDVDDLVTVLQDAPAVHFWISEVVGKPASSVTSVEDWWSGFAGRAQPSLETQMVLAGRADEAALLLRFLDEDRRFTTVRARSVDDVLAFIAATILTVPEDVRLDLLARTLIVRDVSALRQLDGAWNLLILLPYDENMRREAELVKSNHVIFLSDEQLPADIELPPIDQEAVEKILIDGGLAEEPAKRLARAVSKSVVAYKRLASTDGWVRIEWRTQLSDRPLRRAWLVGAWNANRTGDIEVFSPGGFLEMK